MDILQKLRKAKWLTLKLFTVHIQPYASSLDTSSEQSKAFTTGNILLLLKSAAPAFVWYGKMCQVKVRVHIFSWLFVPLYFEVFKWEKILKLSNFFLWSKLLYFTEEKLIFVENFNYMLQLKVLRKKIETSISLTFKYVPNYWKQHWTGRWVSPIWQNLIISQ